MTEHPTSTANERTAAFAESMRRLDAATATLLEVADRMRPGQESEPTVLPGWTLGHLLTHLARNADAVRNLAVWASSGVETPMYTSPESRDAEIEFGANRARDELLDDLAESATNLGSELQAMPPSALTATVRLRNGRAMPGRSLPYFRTQEVYIHLIDLGLGFRPSDWPADFVDTALGRIARTRAEAGDLPAATLRADGDDREWPVGAAGGPTIVGPAPLLLEWLCGRGNTTGLTTSTGTAVPGPIPW